MPGSKAKVWAFAVSQKVGKMSPENDGKDERKMKPCDLFDDKKLDLEGKLIYWSHPEGNPLDQFAIIDDQDLGTHSIVASLSMIARNIGVGKRVRLIFETIE
jgi:hypothetical protein